jgi:hypothetical protein
LACILPVSIGWCRTAEYAYELVSAIS